MKLEGINLRQLFLDIRANKINFIAEEPTPAKQLYPGDDSPHVWRIFLARTIEDLVLDQGTTTPL